ncbi:TIGR02710 family CRISPR-associated CARF protein [Vulcanococcus limneticus]|uniref:TIGR02710 family CRISPR-associated CARF protein n=1 Tax=Vulcanococcus limneticus TaxID=2170428 RepID=UPI00398BD2C2
MTRVLLVTVGGSPDPILKAVESHQPDEVVFICSAPPCKQPSLDQVLGEGTPCRHRVRCPGDGDETPDPADQNPEHWELRPNLVRQLNLQGFRPDLQIIELPDPDDLAQIYRGIRDFCLHLQERFSHCELIGDYSGGTKAMSAGLVMALIERNAQLSFVVGDRKDLVRIRQSEGTRAIAASPLRASRLLQERLPLFLDEHRYDRAHGAVQEFLDHHAAELSGDGIQAAEQLLKVLEALILWDRFRWEEALAVAETTELATTFPELIAWWQRVVASRQWLDRHEPTVAVTGYELVQDLLLNAARRGQRGWLDDAVARLYRALELLAQTYILLERGYDLNDAREEGYRVFEDGTPVPPDGVRKLYSWLYRLEGREGLSACYGKQLAQMNRLLDVRNQSLLAHGLRPVAAQEWQSFQDRVANLVSESMASLSITPGPDPHQLPGKGLLQLNAARRLADLQP